MVKVKVNNKPSNWIENRNGVDIFEYQAPKYRGIDKINSVIAEGMRYRLYAWLRENGIEEDIEDVRNNTSGIREGNEVQIIDDYLFDYDEGDVRISYLYYHNGTVWAVLYDWAENRWYGEFELREV
jgi:hypothetical protein